MSILDMGRIGIAAQALGIGGAAYVAPVHYSKEERPFGAPIGSFEMIQEKLADTKCRVEASRWLTWRAAWRKTRTQRTDERSTLEGTMAKSFASETTNSYAPAAVQIHGGMGSSKELPIERYFRDAKSTEIYEGTSEYQLLVIARSETGLR
jgi:alkylation response protein AidB-like acyl-CoA dehydrogenase